MDENRVESWIELNERLFEDACQAAAQMSGETGEPAASSHRRS